MENNSVSEILIAYLTDEELEDLLTYAPAYSDANFESIESRCLKIINQKRKFSAKKAALTLLAAVMLLAMSSAVFAAATDFRFRPFANFAQIFGSLLNNQYAANVIEIGKTVEANGIEIILLYAYSDGTNVYAILQLRDLMGNLLFYWTEMVCL